MKRGILKLSIFTFSVFLIGTVVYGLPAIYAAVPHLINYQGQLTDKNDTPLTGAQDITFRIYDAETAGTMLWEEPHTGVIVEQGIVSIMLGSINNLNLPFDKEYFLEIKVGNEVMSPRQRMASVGYAIRAEKADAAISANTADIVDGFHASSTPSANKILVADSNAKLPTQALKVYDSGWFSVMADNTYTKTHNLGTEKCLIHLWYSSDGSTYTTLLSPMSITDVNMWGGPNILNLTTNNIQIRIMNSIALYFDSSGIHRKPTSGYYRLIMLALE